MNCNIPALEELQRAYFHKKYSWKFHPRLHLKTKKKCKTCYPMLPIILFTCWSKFLFRKQNPFSKLDFKDIHTHHVKKRCIKSLKANFSSTIITKYKIIGDYNNEFIKAVRKLFGHINEMMNATPRSYENSYRRALYNIPTYQFMCRFLYTYPYHIFLQIYPEPTW